MSADANALQLGYLPPNEAQPEIGYQPGESTLNNVMIRMEGHLKRFPGRLALRWAQAPAIHEFDGKIGEQGFPTEEVTYATFRRLIYQTAKGLADLGVGKGDRVIIFLPMGLGMYTAMFATQALGAIAVFLDSWARRSHLGASAQCVDPKAMISHQAAFALIDGVEGFEGLELKILAGPGSGDGMSARLEELMQTPGLAELCPVASEHTALITFTTGSSGTPKGANRTHRFLAAQRKALSQVLPYDADDVDMPAFPIFSLYNLAEGVATVLPALNLAAPSEHDSAALAKQIIFGELTCTTLSPSMLNNLSAFCLANQVQFPSLRRVVTGGAPISKDNVSDFAKVAPNAEIWVLYGSTEVEPMAHIEAQEMLALKGDPDPEIVEEGVNVGHVDPALDYKFLRIVRGPIDGAKTPIASLEVAEGEVGEFVVAGDHVCQGYYNNEEAFRKSKIRDASGRVWHRTGDLARIDSKGYLWMVGRIHNVLERCGRYLFPVRAEVLLNRFPFVKQAAFLGLPDEQRGQRTAVVIVLDTEVAIADDALAAVSRVFEKNQIPIDAFYCVDKIPMDPRHHSKVEYTTLRETILADGVPDRLALTP